MSDPCSLPAELKHLEGVFRQNCYSARDLIWALERSSAGIIPEESMESVCFAVVPYYNTVSAWIQTTCKDMAFVKVCSG